MSPPTVKQETSSPVHPNWIWRTCRFVLRLLFAVWLNYRVQGHDQIPATGGGLIVSNHQSSLDPLLIGLPLERPVSFVARDGLFRIPIVGWIMRRTYVMPINRESAGSAVIRESCRRMENGFLVGIFPEGTRSEDGEVHEFKPGFLALVKRARLPVYPVGIAGAHRAMPRDSLLLRPHPVRVVFGAPFPIEEVQRILEEGRERELTEMIRQRVIDCQRRATEWLPGGAG